MPPITLASRTPLDRLTTWQDGVVTRRQLREHGYDDEAVRWQVAARRWRAFGSSVVVLHNGPLTPRQRQWVAVLSQHAAALAGVSAAGEFGLTGFEDATVHLVIPHGARPHPLPGVRLHVSRHFSLDDLHPARALPTVRVERALVDAASWMPAKRKACAILAAGVQQRLTTATRLRAEIASHERMRHHKLLTHVLGDIEGGAHSFAEIDFGRFAKRAGLPQPKRQVFRYDGKGRRRWLDAQMDGFSVEIDGAIHLRPMRYWDDMERQNDLVIVTGQPILRFATVALRIDEATVIAQLVAAARRFSDG